MEARDKWTTSILSPPSKQKSYKAGGSQGTEKTLQFTTNIE